ncbi:MAG: flavin reductase [Propionibacteriales bacterium]|nr:flavin reductase [Propionibacteriales bacterium]
MTIHSSNPFAEPDDPPRRFRGRLGGAVSLWTTGDTSERSGLTVSSVMVGLGEPGRIFALLDPDAAFTEQLQQTGVAVVHLLRGGDVDLAEAFAGTAPAPGGPFRLRSWGQTGHGPRLPGCSAALVRLESARTAGWSLLVEAVLDEVHLEDESELEGDRGLEHRRGRYHRA